MAGRRTGTRRGPVRRARLRRTTKWAEAAERRRLEQDLRRGLSEDGFELHYQPRVALGSGATVGAEALLRWPNRQRTGLSPARFLPLAERSSLGTNLGGWVLRRACVEAGSWPGAATVSVNISPRHLVDGAVLEHVGVALDASGLAPERLELELPEAVLLDAGVEVLLTLAALQDLGVGVALDNFGAGHASLGVPLRLPLTALKLDRSLIRALPYAAEDAAIVRALVDLAHALGLKVVATGLESGAQRSFLARIGCDEGQGHLVSAALPLDQFREHLLGT